VGTRKGAGRIDQQTFIATYRKVALATRPRTNGIVERFHKTMFNEFYRITFRKKMYTTLADLQTDLDRWVQEYSEVRAHQGRWCYGKTPMQPFDEAINHALSDQVLTFTQEQHDLYDTTLSSVWAVNRGDAGEQPLRAGAVPAGVCGGRGPAPGAAPRPPR
jgi:hypothetical protein